MVMPSKSKHKPQPTLNIRSLKSLKPHQQEKFLKSLSLEEKARLNYSWKFWARPEQIAPPLDGDWLTWLILSGRGWGKTRTGAEWVLDVANTDVGCRIALIAPTAGDARDIIVEGESGILETSPPWNRPTYEPSKKKLTWKNGTTAFTYSAEEPDRLRGKQHHHGWGDELAAWKFPKETWDMFEMGLRLGNKPKSIVTTTPRPIKLIRDLIDDENTIITKGTTFDNLDNLAPAFGKRLLKYDGTRLGRQELMGEILDDNPYALWSLAKIEYNRLREAPDLVRIVVAIDPPVTTGEKADECGIIVAGIDKNDRAYILADRSCQGFSPLKWCEEAVKAYHHYSADRIVAEVNNGGDLVETVLRQVDASVSYKKVHASRGKVTRAEPISAFYERGLVHHVGNHATLESQMCEFTSDFDKKAMGYSPDRVDALVWVLTDLLVGGKESPPQIRRF